VKDRVELVKPGEISLLVPDVDEIHEMANFSDRATVEIHVYGKDLVGLQRRVYDVDKQTVKWFASDKFDNC
jgi:predicted metal-dependent enzyme (double-stranded beta helix superfamily)